MSKKKIFILMNCAADEICAYLRSSKSVQKEYEVDTMYTHDDERRHDVRETIYAGVKNADVVVVQNVQNISWLRNDAIEKILKPGCIFIKLCFWRFDGFWPFPQENFRIGFSFLPNELGDISNFDKYINSEIPASRIREHHEAELHKLKQIDHASDIRMYDFFLSNYKNFNLFSDRWHPTSYFFYKISKKIISILGLRPDIKLRANVLINHNRYRLIFNAVANELNLSYDQYYLRCHNHVVSREIFFEFSRYLSSFLKDEGPDKVGRIFDQWVLQEGLTTRPLDMAKRGIVSRSAPGWEPLQAVQLTPTERRAGLIPPPNPTAAPWLEIDLRDLREVRGINVRNGTDQKSKAGMMPFSVSISIDREEWQVLSFTEFVSRDTLEGGFYSIGFDPPIICRYVRLTANWLRRPVAGEMEVLSLVTC